MADEMRASEGQPFAEFYRSARDPVARALALTLGSTSLALDAVDEAMTRAYQRWDRVARYASPEGWVYRVALNYARSAWRKRRREVHDVYEAGASSDTPIDVDVERAIAGPEPSFRAVVVLRLYLDWSVETTAGALGIRPGTVKSRLSRALDRLEAELGGDRT